MLIIPELRTVVLQPPRTGTTSVRDAVLEKYPLSFMLYRHMEASGIPKGYDRWRRVCQIRNPVERLISVYKYMCEPPIRPHTSKVWVERCQQQTEKGWYWWLTKSDYPFAINEPNDTDDFRPQYEIDNPIAEQIKSQREWALGATDYLRFEEISNEAKNLLDIDIEHKNASIGDRPHISPMSMSFIRTHHRWDCDFYGI